MVTKDQIQRINELYKKKKEVGLTKEEEMEQEKLRKLYLQSFRENFKSQLQNIKVVSPEEYERHKKEEQCSCGHNHHHEHHEDCDCNHHKH